MGVYFPRSATAEAKFGQAIENGPRRFPQFWSEIFGFDFQILPLFFFFSTFCNSHSMESVFFDTLLMNDYGSSLDQENDIAHRISRIRNHTPLSKKWSGKYFPLNGRCRKLRRKTEKKVSWRGIEPVSSTSKPCPSLAFAVVLRGKYTPICVCLPTLSQLRCRLSSGTLLGPH